MGSVAAVELLLACPETDVNRMDGQGHSPINLAFAGQHHDVVLALLRHPSIDPNIRSVKGLAPIHIAAGGNWPEVIKVLCARDETDVNLLTAGTRPGRFALSIAAKLGFVEVVKALLDCPRIDVEARTLQGRTAYDVAVRNGKEQCAGLLEPPPHEEEEEERPVIEPKRSSSFLGRLRKRSERQKSPRKAESRGFIAG
jgi:hypothetical protein